MKTLTTATAALLIGLAIPAIAADRDDRGRHDRSGSSHVERHGEYLDINSTAAPRQGWISAAELTKKLSAGGLTPDRIKAERGQYEVNATDASGARVKVYVDPTNGEIIRRENRRRG